MKYELSYNFKILRTQILQILNLFFIYNINKSRKPWQGNFRAIIKIIYGKLVIEFVSGY